MKKLYLFVIVLVLDFVIVYSQGHFFDRFDYYRVSSDFNGSAFNGSVILVYGSGGVILRSEDGGNSWKNTQLAETHNIVSVANLGENFYGVTTQGWLIKSTDNGNNWLEYNLFDTTPTYKILAYKGNLYCLNSKGIIALQPNLEKIEEYVLQLDTPYYDFSIFKNEIIYSAGKGKLGIISLSNNSSRIVDLQKLGFCVDCSIPKILCNDDNTLFFEMNMHLFKFDGVSFGEIVKPMMSSAPFSMFNEELFEIFTRYNPLMGLDSLYFYKVDYKDSQNVRINFPGNDRYIRELNFTHLNFLSRDTLIAVGKNKLIYMSYNGGQNWVLKSFYVPYMPYRVSSNYAFDVNLYAQFFSTKDGGVTWLPQRNFDPLFFEGKYLPGGEGIAFMDSTAGFLYQHSLVEAYNFAYTTDGGETVRLKKEKGLFGYFREIGNGEAFPTCSFGNRFIFTFPGYVNTSWKYTILLVMNKELEVEKRVVLDSSCILFISSYDNDAIIAVAKNYKHNDKRVVIIKSKDTCSSWSEVMELTFVHPNDVVTTIKPYKLIHDYLFFSFSRQKDKNDEIKGMVYLIDLKSLRYKELFSSDSTDINSVVLMGEKVILLTAKFTRSNFWPFIVENRLDSSPGSWTDITPKSSEYAVYHSDENQGLISIIGYDKRLRVKATWFAKEKTATPVETGPEAKSNLFVSYPEPNPASNFVTFKIWWDKSSSVDFNNVKVCDVLGNYLTQQEFEFLQFNEYSGKIIWKIGDIPSGVYFFVISIGNSFKATPVVIYR